MSFKVGDVVWLKSGGAKMTVKAIGRDGDVYTIWHNQTPEGFKEMSGQGYNEAVLTDQNPDSFTLDVSTASTWDQP